MILNELRAVGLLLGYLPQAALSVEFFVKLPGFFVGTIEVDPKFLSYRFSQWVGGDFAGVFFYFLSPSQWVVIPGRFRLVSFVQMQDERGRSPLHLAAAQGHQPGT